MSMEYVALRQNYNHLHSDFEASQAKTTDVAAELLSLANAKALLTNQTQALQVRMAEM